MVVETRGPEVHISIRERRGLNNKLQVLRETPRLLLQKVSPKKSPYGDDEEGISRGPGTNNQLLGVKERLQLILPFAVERPKEFSRKLRALQSEASQQDSCEESAECLCALAQAIEREGLHDKKRLDSAECYRLALTLRPEWQKLDLIFHYGNCLYASGRYGEAVEAYRSGVEGLSVECLHERDASCPLPPPAINAKPSSATRAPFSARIYVNLGVALEAQDKLEEAMQAYRGAISLYPDYPAAHKLLGGIWIALGRMQAAEGSLMRAVELNPELAEAWTDLGTARHWLGDIQGALPAFEKAIELQPTQVVAHWNLAMAQRDAGEFQDAICSLEMAVQLQPTLWGAHLQLGLCALLLGQPRGGASVAEEALAAAASKANKGLEGVTTAIQAMLRTAENTSAADAEEAEDALLFNDQFGEQTVMTLPMPASVRGGAVSLAKLWTKHCDRRGRDGKLGARLARLRHTLQASGARRLQPLKQIGIGSIRLNRERSAGNQVSGGEKRPSGALPEGYSVAHKTKSHTGGYQVILNIDAENGQAPAVETSGRALPGGKSWRDTGAQVKRQRPPSNEVSPTDAPEGHLSLRVWEELPGGPEGSPEAQQAASPMRAALKRMACVSKNARAQVMSLVGKKGGDSPLQQDRKGGMQEMAQALVQDQDKELFEEAGKPEAVHAKLFSPLGRGRYGRQYQKLEHASEGGASGGVPDSPPRVLSLRERHQQQTTPTTPDTQAPNFLSILIADEEGDTNTVDTPLLDAIGDVSSWNIGEADKECDEALSDREEYEAADEWRGLLDAEGRNVQRSLLSSRG
ncbi:hypothetical protein CYMTET_52933 [Cymbomonas tetramitiformis]|uniref:Uncharacterized protein n=1 Tax=Cymbomonas tetramitiformis TaxID=36881 RepID=A0AAE0BJS5_9CHLO|nr:hypothetical protein CYMTET_52933 [Cymbomonas tetramitiformis]